MWWWKAPRVNWSRRSIAISKLRSKKARCMYTALLSRKGIRRCTALPFIDFEHVEGVSKDTEETWNWLAWVTRPRPKATCWIWAWVIRTAWCWRCPVNWNYRLFRRRGKTRWSFWKELTSNWSPVAAKNKITSSVEPYKGKGIRYVGEFVRMLNLIRCLLL